MELSITSSFKKYIRLLSLNIRESKLVFATNPHADPYLVAIIEPEEEIDQPSSNTSRFPNTNLIGDANKSLKIQHNLVTVCHEDCVSSFHRFGPLFISGKYEISELFGRKNSISSKKSTPIDGSRANTKESSIPFE